MKRITWIITLFLFSSSFSTKLAAQENLNALVKKCENETMKGVYMEIIHTKNTLTKKFEPTITKINIEFNPTLINEFVKALQKDEEKAIQKIEKKTGKQLISLFYSFDNADYTFYYGENKECTGIKILITASK